MVAVRAIIEWCPWPPLWYADRGREVLAYREDVGVFAAVAYEDEETGEETWFGDGGHEDLTGDLPTLWAPMPKEPESEKAASKSCNA